MALKTCSLVMRTYRARSLGFFRAFSNWLHPYIEAAVLTFVTQHRLSSRNAHAIRGSFKCGSRTLCDQNRKSCIVFFSRALSAAASVCNSTHASAPYKSTGGWASCKLQVCRSRDSSASYLLTESVVTPVRRCDSLLDLIRMMSLELMVVPRYLIPRYTILDNIESIADRIHRDRWDSLLLDRNILCFTFI